MAGIRALAVLASLPDLTGVRQVDHLADEQDYLIPAPVFSYGGPVSEGNEQWMNGFIIDQTASSPAVDVYEIESCLITPNSAIFTKSGNIVEESLFPYVRKEDVTAAFKPFLFWEEGFHPRELSMMLRNITKCHDTLLFGREHGEMGYFHWIHSIVPRLMMSRERYPSERVLVALTETFQPQSLSRIGIGPDALLVSDGNTLQCDKIVYCTPMVRPDLARSGGFFERCVAASAQLHTLGPARGSRHRVIISRRDADIRRLAEEDRLVERLQGLGFESVTLSDLSFDSQLELFASAEVVIGAHGAGLANVAFMQPGSHMIELLSQDRLWPTYRGVAARSGVAYSPYVASRSGVLRENDSDMSVDVDHLVDFVHQVLERQSPRKRPVLT